MNANFRPEGIYLNRVVNDQVDGHIRIDFLGSPPILAMRGQCPPDQLTGRVRR